MLNAKMLKAMLQSHTTEPCYKAMPQSHTINLSTELCYKFMLPSYATKSHASKLTTKTIIQH